VESLLRLRMLLLTGSGFSWHTRSIETDLIKEERNSP